MKRLMLALLMVLGVSGVSPIAWGQPLSIDFDNPTPPGFPEDLLEGVFQGVDWGTGQWRWEGPFPTDPTNHIFFSSLEGTSRAFTFSPGPRILDRVDVVDIWSGSGGVVTFSDDRGQTVSQTVSPGERQTVITGWTQGSTTVTVGYTLGWLFNLDNVVHAPTGPPPPQQTLTITKAGAGQGTITSAPAGIDCGAVCLAEFAENTQVTLTARPEPASIFDGWSGDADCVDGIVTMSVPVQCVATFALGSAGIGIDGMALRFFGNGVDAPDRDRVKIRIDDPTTANDPPFPVDVGAGDFTIEFWMNAIASENTAQAVACGSNIAWINGNIIVDRDRFLQDRKFGLSIAGGTLVFGVSGDGTGDLTICGIINVLDGAWHHVAIQRRRTDGLMQLFVDGTLDAEAIGPDGDISYPNDGVPGAFCGGPCVNSDPFLVIGAEKHDAGADFPSYSGFFDEMRISDVLRYAGSFVRPSSPFTPDANAVALYDFNEGAGDVIRDARPLGDGRDGVLRVGGSPVGPVRAVAP